jgi:hypothetical protein
MTPTVTLRNFRSITKFSYIGLPLNMREQLTADRTYYVRTDGSDSNNGLANTSGGAFLTIQKAIDVICHTLDLAGWNVYIQVANGTYSGSINLKNYVTSGQGAKVTLQGNNVTPSNVVLTNAANTDLITMNAIFTPWTIGGFKVTVPGSNGGAGSSINVVGNSQLNISGKMEYGNCPGFHIYGWSFAKIFISADYTISGYCQRHMVVMNSSALVVSNNITVTVSGTPNMLYDVVYAQDLALAMVGPITFTGTGITTARRYYADRLNSIDGYGKGINFIPGGAAGVTANGGVYA